MILSQPTLSHYETGKRVPGTMSEIAAMARVLHVKSEALVNCFANQRADYARIAYLEKLTHDSAW